MNFEKITAQLVVIGGSLSGLGAALGKKLGDALGTPRDQCGWQYIVPTHTPEQLNAMIQGTLEFTHKNEKILANLGECTGPDPWIFAMFGAIPGVLYAVISASK